MNFLSFNSLISAFNKSICVFNSAIIVTLFIECLISLESNIFTLGIFFGVTE